MKAIEKIKGAAESGQIRRFTGNDYARDLTSGDAVAVIGWSGDAVQLQADNPNIEWRMPTEGCMLWSDNMVIPVGAPNPTAAEAWMNYVYDPENQAQIAEYVNYVTPVEGVKEILEKTGPGTGEEPADLPERRVHQELLAEPTLEGEEEQNVIQAFNAGWRSMSGVSRADGTMPPRRRLVPYFLLGPGMIWLRPLLRRPALLHGRNCRSSRASSAASNSTGTGRTTPTRSRSMTRSSSAPSSTPGRRPCSRC